MQKKIVMDVVINGANVNAEALKLKLAELGESVQIEVLDEIHVATAQPDASLTWVMVTADETEPYFKAVGPFIQGDEAFSDEEIEALKASGVCVQLAIQYPRSDRYGVPAIATTLSHAEGFVAQHGFPVLPVMDINGEDSGDDSSEVVWMGIAPRIV